MKSLLFIFCIVILVNCNGCFAPKTRNSNTNTCNLITKEYTLDFSGNAGEQVIMESIKGCNDPECIITTTLIVTPTLAVGSFIVSGSIVVVGNTVHWIEGQGKCDDTASKKAINKLRSTTKTYGGVVINTTEDAIIWLKSLLPTIQK